MKVRLGTQVVRDLTINVLPAKSDEVSRSSGFGPAHERFLARLVSERELLSLPVESVDFLGAGVAKQER